MSSFAGNKNIRENDNKTKEIHKQIQGHGCLGREYIYLNPCDNAIELRKGIEKFMQYYNTERHHQGIDNETPERKYENNKLLIRTHKAA